MNYINDGCMNKNPLLSSGEYNLVSLNITIYKYVGVWISNSSYIYFFWKNHVFISRV